MGEGAIGGAAVATALIGLMIWVVKRLVNAALENMQANTKAIDANTAATQALAATLTQHVAIGDERDRTMFKQLDRIEGHWK